MPSPLVQSTVLATALGAASNIVAQQLEQRNRGETTFSVSLPELLRFVVLSILTAPPNFYWQHFLERQFPARKLDAAHTPLPQHEGDDASQLMIEEPVPEKDESANLNWKNTAIKWFVDCITMGALLNTTAFLIIMGLLKGRSVGEIAVALKTETLPIIWASYKVWPLASVVNFALIPVDWRVVFLSFVGLVWGVYMSFMAAKQ